MFEYNLILFKKNSWYGTMVVRIMKREERSDNFPWTVNWPGHPSVSDALNFDRRDKTK